MSNPTQKLRPSERSTTTLVAGSRSASRNRSHQACISFGLMALSFSGRFTVMIPTLPSASYRTRSDSMPRLLFLVF